MFSDGVKALLHFKVFPLDAHIVSLVETIKNLLRINWNFGNIFVDFRDFSVEDQFYVFQL